MSLSFGVIFLSILGVLLCRKIHKEKKVDKPLVCYAGADCDSVVRGQFSTFLGIGLEVYGLFYYLFILISYLLLNTLDFVYEPTYSLLIVIASGGAFLLSVFLTYVQAFVIKTWCSWCLISASLSTLIFIFGLLNIL